MAKRGVAFFLIINKWAEYVKTMVVNDRIDWFDIPGYSSVLKAILTELKERKICEYPDALIEATCSLLSNEDIFSMLIEIIFKKTNVHIPQEVNKTMNI